MPTGTKRSYELRCPIHGFIKLNDWERTIVDDSAFQRLRRIRQLAWSEYIYPGATHTRFEHSLGVMHTATRIYDAVAERSEAVLASELCYNGDGLARDRQLVRLAALLHDVGHAPFSHGAEELFPKKQGGDHYVHEDYSTAIIRTKLRNVIENHPLNANYGFTADELADEHLAESAMTKRVKLPVVCHSQIVPYLSNQLTSRWCCWRTGGCRPLREGAPDCHRAGRKLTPRHAARSACGSSPEDC